MAPHSSTLAWKILWMEEPWKAAVHRVARSRTRLSDFTFTFHFHALEKEMATHTSVLAWRIPGTGEPGGLPSVGSQSRTLLKQLSSSSKIKSVTVSTVLLSICHEVMGLDAMIFIFWMLSFKPSFSCSSFTFIKRLFSSSLSAIRVVSSAYLRLLIFSPSNLDSSLCFFQSSVSHDVLCI